MDEPRTDASGAAERAAAFGTLFGMITQFWVPQALAAAATLDLPDILASRVAQHDRPRDGHGREPRHASPPQAAFMDLNMMVMLAGKERTESELRRLLARADLRLARVLPLATPQQIVEAVPA